MQGQHNEGTTLAHLWDVTMYMTECININTSKEWANQNINWSSLGTEK